MRKKHNKYVQAPEASLDLHGATRDEARTAVRVFLADCRSSGFKRVRIVTGKGLHSPDGRGVVKEAVKALLNAEGYGWTEAKLGDGGSGALEVRLT